MKLLGYLFLSFFLLAAKPAAKNQQTELLAQLEKLADKHQRKLITKFLYENRSKFDTKTFNESIESFYEPFYSEAAQRFYLEALALPAGSGEIESKLISALALEKDQPLALRELYMNFIAQKRCSEAEQTFAKFEEGLLPIDAKRFFRIALDDCYKRIISLDEIQKWKVESEFYAPLIWQRIFLRALDQGQILFVRDRVSKLKSEYNQFAEFIYIESLVLQQLHQSPRLLLQKYRSSCGGATQRQKSRYRWAEQYCSKEKTEIEG